MAKVKTQRSINPYVLVILSFIIIILLGSLLLNMPFANKSGKWGNYMDSFLLATSGTCVTGLTTLKDTTYNTLTFAGQVILAVLIQIGGLGFVTVLTFLITLFKRKLQFRDRYLISQMVSSTNFADVVKFVRKLILISFIAEFIGFLFGLPVFLTMFPKDSGRAVWYSLFHSISAFNNAGFDLLENGYIGGLAAAGVNTVAISTGNWMYYYFCSYQMLLIVTGGISFLVIIEVFTSKKRPRQWSALTKIVLWCTLFLLVVGSLLIYLTDGFKGDGSMSYFDALFQSVSSRTAGFATYSSDSLSVAGKIISCMLMFIGGAPLGTAGGIKITTIFLLFLAMSSYIRGRNVIAFKRYYSVKMVLKALSLVFTVVIVLIIAYLCLNAFGLQKGYALGEGELANIKTETSMFYFFDMFSCFGTVGFMIGAEAYYSVGAKIVLCVLMFIGRLGPMTFLSIFQRNLTIKNDSHFWYVEDDFLIG